MISGVFLRPLFWAGVAVLILSACTARVIDQPVATSLDRHESKTQRIAAIALVPQDRAMELLPLVFSPRHPMQVRSAAVDRMVDAEGDRFWSRISVSITRINDWPMLQLICDRAASENRSEMIPALVLSWARPSQRFDDTQRPEHEAIATLSDRADSEITLWQLLASDESEVHDRVRVAAWTVLSRQLSDEECRVGLANASADSGLVSELKTVADSLDQLPPDREGVLRMRSILEASEASQWAQFADTRTIMGDRPGPSNLSLRHFPSIAVAGDRTAIALSDLENHLKNARHISRGSGAHREVVSESPDRLSDHASSLSWADRLVLWQIMQAMEQASLRRAIFEQADADKADTTTEYGGVLTWDENHLVTASLFAPARRQHDQIFHASDDCVSAMHTGLAHYHFHAQEYDNAVWAGPGGGDFAFADALHANCVVFTFIDRDTINVDAYFPGQIVIDLGCIARPRD